MRPHPAESDDRGVRHRRRRALYVELDIQRYAKVRGLVIRDIYRQVDSTMAALALLWVRGTDKLVRRTTIDALFSGHWNGHLNIEDVAAVTAVLEGARADLDGWPEFHEDAGRAELQRLHARLATAGIFSAPAIVVGTADSAEIFYGRAHLPMVRWLLQGRTGPPPI